MRLSRSFVPTRLELAALGIYGPPESPVAFKCYSRKADSQKRCGRWKGKHLALSL